MTTPKHYPSSSFRPLTEADLALVWQWRNQAGIRANMHQDTPISWQQHQAWFAQRDASTSPFFVFYQDGRPIGALYFKPHSSTGLEWGCYLGETNVWPGSGLLLEIAALDYAAAKSDCNTLHADVLSFNHSVLKLHQLFGYQETAITAAASTRNGVHYQIHHFCYATADWLSNRAAILAKLPKQIASAAAFIEFIN